MDLPFAFVLCLVEDGGTSEKRWPSPSATIGYVRTMFRLSFIGGTRYPVVGELAYQRTQSHAKHRIARTDAT